MSKYSNKNFKVSIPEYIGAALFICFIVVAIFFFGEFIKTSELSNIGRTKVDFIIQAPSVEQIDEISKLDSVDRVVPYVFRTVNVSSKRGSVSGALFLIDKSEDVDYTAFSDKLIIREKNVNGNTIFITEDLAKTTGLKVGDSFNLSIDGNSLSFIVGAIYKSDYRRVGGSLLAIRTEEINQALSSSKYNGAFISSNNESATAGYLKKYQPLGDLRTEDEFENADAYERYLETRKQSDSTTEAFSTSEYVKEVLKRNSSRLLRNAFLAILFVVLALIEIIVLMKFRATVYTVKCVGKDIKDNYSFRQEAGMYLKYFIIVGVLLAFASIISCISCFIWGISGFFIPLSICSVIICIIVVAIVAIAEISFMKKRHFVKK